MSSPSTNPPGGLPNAGNMADPQISWEKDTSNSDSDRTMLKGMFTGKNGKPYVVTVSYHAQYLQGRHKGAEGDLDCTVQKMVEDIGPDELISLVGYTVNASLDNFNESKILKDGKVVTTWENLEKQQDDPNTADFTTLKSTVGKVIKAFETNFPRSQGQKPPTSAAGSPTAGSSAAAAPPQTASGQNGSSPTPPPLQPQSPVPPPPHVAPQSQPLTSPSLELQPHASEQEQEIEILLEEDLDSGSGSGRVSARGPDASWSQMVDKKRLEEFIPKLQKNIQAGYKQLNDEELSEIKQIRELLLRLDDDRLLQAINTLKLDVNLDAHKPFIRDLIVKEGDIVSTLSQRTIRPKTVDGMNERQFKEHLQKLINEQRNEEYEAMSTKLSEFDDKVGKVSCGHICALFTLLDALDQQTISDEEGLKKIMNIGVNEREKWNKSHEVPEDNPYLNFDDIIDDVNSQWKKNHERDVFKILFNDLMSSPSEENVVRKSLNAWKMAAEEAKKKGGKAYLALTIKKQNNDNPTMLVYYPEGKDKPVLFDSHTNAYRGIPSVGALHMEFDSIEALVDYIDKKFPDSSNFANCAPVLFRSNFYSE